MSSLVSLFIKEEVIWWLLLYIHLWYYSPRIWWRDRRHRFAPHVSCSELPLGVYLCVFSVGLSKGQAGSKVVLNLPSIYAVPALGRLKLSEVLHLLFYFIFTLLPRIECGLNIILSHLNCEGTITKIFEEYKFPLKTMFYRIKSYVL